MSSLIVVPNKKEELSSILSKDIKGVILGIDKLSIYDVNFTIEEAILLADSTNKEVIIAINKMLHNTDLTLVKEVLEKIKDSKIKKVLFYDLGVYNIAKKINLDKELIISIEHQNASTLSNSFYYNKGVTSAHITSDLTHKEIINIKKNTKMQIYYTAYGYLPIFYSRRKLLTNYFNYIKKSKTDDTYYISNNNLKYMIKEREYGSIIYSPLVNLQNEIDKLVDIDYLIIDLSYCFSTNIIDKFIERAKEENPYIGFFNTKTTYKLKGDDNEK